MPKSTTTGFQPATVQDTDDLSDNAAAGPPEPDATDPKQAPPEASGKDTHSDSGYGSTLLSGASGDKPTATSTTPVPAATKDPQASSSATVTDKPAKPGSPSKKHRRSSSKGSKKSALTTQSAPATHSGWYWDGYQYVTYAPSEHYPADYGLGRPEALHVDPHTYQPPVTHPAYVPPSPEFYTPPPLAPVWTRRVPAHPRPHSYYDSSYDTSYFPPVHEPAPYHTPAPEYGLPPRDEYRDAPFPVPSTRVSTQPVRPGLRHAYTDTRASRRHSAAYDDDLRFDVPYDSTRSSSHTRRSARSTRHSPGMEFFRHPDHDQYASDWSALPRGATSTREARTEIDPLHARTSSRTSYSRTTRDDERARSSNRSSHRHSASYSAAGSSRFLDSPAATSRSRRHSISPGAAYPDVTETRRSRRRSPSKEVRTGGRQDSPDTPEAKKQKEAERHIQDASGPPTTDQLYKDLRHTSTLHQARPAAIERSGSKISSRHSERSARSRPSRRHGSGDESIASSNRFLRITDPVTGKIKEVAVGDRDFIEVLRVEHLSPGNSPTEERAGKTTSRKGSGNSDLEEKENKRSDRDRERSDRQDRRDSRERRRSRDGRSTEKQPERASSRVSSVRKLLSSVSSRSRGSSDADKDTRRSRRQSWVQQVSPIPEQGSWASQHRRHSPH